MSAFVLIFDALLALSLLGLGLAALRVRKPFEAVILFILFGLVMAVTWIRVDAPDLALAEAAIGSGITGALFLGVLRRLQVSRDPERAPLFVRVPAALVCTGLGAVLTGIIVNLWSQPPGLRDIVYSSIPESGVKNPVTAVILNFRAYDTLLEIGVLLIALLGVYVLTESHTVRDHPTAEPSTVLRTLVHNMAPVIVLTAVYVVWVGYKAPGGAFQAGALLGGLGVMVLLNRSPMPLHLQQIWSRILISGGFAVFALVAVLCAPQGGLLTFPAEQAKHWILVIEIACTISIGMTLTGLFAGAAGLLPQTKTKGSP